jgi:hypothetical protein
MIGPALYLWMMAQGQPPTVSWHKLMSIKRSPIVALTLTPDGDGWLVGGMSASWSGVGRVDCEGPRNIVAPREGMPTLKITLECPAEEGKP